MISSTFKKHIQLQCVEQADPGVKSSSRKPVGVLQQAGEWRRSEREGAFLSTK